MNLPPQDENPSTTAQVNEANASPSKTNYGTVVFGGFAIVTLIVCAARGFVPIYAVEAAGWGALAWYCRNKTLTEKANMAVLAVAVLVAALEGYSLGRSDTGHFFGSQEENVTHNSPTANATSSYYGMTPVGNTNWATPDTSTKTNGPKCPSAIPAGTKGTVLDRSDLDKVVGTKAELDKAEYYEGTNEDLAYNRTPWKLYYHVRNDTNVCVTQAELEVTIKYKDSSFKERHTIALGPILSPNEEFYNELLLSRRTGEQSDPLVMEQWRITKAWGFKIPQ